MTVCRSCGNSISDHAPTCAAILNNPHLMGNSPGKWGSWLIADMPAQVLESALRDVEIQIERASGRLQHPTRAAEFLKYIGKLTQMKTALETEKANRSGR